MGKNRDELGRFVKGNTVAVGHGRPPVTREKKYMERFQKKLRLKDVSEITGKLIELAKDGNIRAIKVLFAYAFGQPPQYVEANIQQKSLSVDLQVAIEKIYGSPESDTDS